MIRAYDERMKPFIIGGLVFVVFVGADLLLLDGHLTYQFTNQVKYYAFQWKLTGQRWVGL